MLWGLGGCGELPPPRANSGSRRPRGPSAFLGFPGTPYPSWAGMSGQAQSEFLGWTSVDPEAALLLACLGLQEG